MTSNIQILLTGVGSYLPKNKTSNNDLAKSIDTSDEWITKRTGIKFRHFVSIQFVNLSRIKSSFYQTICR